MTSLYVDGYGVTGLGAFGIVANIVGIFDLLQKKNRQIFFNLLLSSQLVFDTLLLATFLIRSFFTYFVGIPNEQFFMYYLILCPLRRFSICSSMFMTVTLTFSRANAVEKPLQNRNSIYSQSERIKRDRGQYQSARGPPGVGHSCWRGLGSGPDSAAGGGGCCLWW